MSKMKLWTFRAAVTHPETFYVASETEEGAREKALDPDEWIDSIDIDGTVISIMDLELVDVADDE